MDVKQLVDCKKSIINRRRPDFKLENRYYRADLNLECELENVNMTMFLRKHDSSFEDFCVGLRMNTPNQYTNYAVVLLRFQGPHGGQSDTREHENLHNSFHIHQYSERDFERMKKRASVDSKFEANFNSYEEAVCSFLDYCNIEDDRDIFSQEKVAITQYKMNLSLVGDKDEN
jgi:hypothetical protein